MEGQINLLEVALKKVLENDHAEITLISDIEEYQTVKVFRKVLKKFIKGFKQSAKAAWQSHLKALDLGDTTLEHLVNYKLFLRCVDFYKEDYRRVGYMISEFNYYMVWGGHFFYALTGKKRKQEDMYDMLKDVAMRDDILKKKIEEAEKKDKND